MTKFTIGLAIFLISISFNPHVYADDEHATVFGSVLGAVIGGGIGHQFGGGSGKYVTTSIGAIIGSRVGRDFHQRLYEKEQYHPTYAVESAYPVRNSPYHNQLNHRVIYVADDDYLIQQEMSNAAKRRNMIRNGEADPLEMPHDVSEVQTSWDDPFN